VGVIAGSRGGGALEADAHDLLHGLELLGQYFLAGAGDLVGAAPFLAGQRRHPAAAFQSGYQQAEDLFKKWSGGATLHQLRHSALTHDAEDGWDVTMLKTKSGHTSLRSLERYARPSTEALARMQREHDRNRRH
jgi:integrase